MKIENQRGPIVGSYSGLDQKQAACEADVSRNLAWRGATTKIIFPNQHKSMMIIIQSAHINNNHISSNLYQ